MALSSVPSDLELQVAQSFISAWSASSTSLSPHLGQTGTFGPNDQAIWYAQQLNLIDSSLLPAWFNLFSKANPGLSGILPPAQAFAVWVQTHVAELAEMLANSKERAVQAAFDAAAAYNWSPIQLQSFLKATSNLTPQQVAQAAKLQTTAPISLKRFASKAARDRAIRIASHELFIGYNQAAQTWVDAHVQAGSLPPMQRIWSTARDERVCPGICKPRDGLDIDQNGFDLPPAHLACRCGVVYTSAHLTKGAAILPRFLLAEDVISKAGAISLDLAGVPDEDEDLKRKRKRGESVGQVGNPASWVDNSFGNSATGYQTAAVSKAEHDFASTQCNLPDHLVEQIAVFQAAINPADVGPGGLEDQPHITVLYGLHPGTSPFDVRQSLDGCGPASATFDGLDTFPAGDNGVPLIVRVASPDLQALHHCLETLPHTSTFPTYQPHVTLAYLTPEAAGRYTGATSPLQGTILLETLSFCDTDEQQTEIQLVSEDLAKSNPYHDAKGEFASHSSGNSGNSGQSGNSGNQAKPKKKPRSLVSRLHDIGAQGNQWKLLFTHDPDGAAGLADDLDLNSVHDWQVVQARAEAYATTQHALRARGVSDPVTIYRAGSLSDELVSASFDPEVARYFNHGADPTPYTVRRYQILADVDALAGKTNPLKESELVIRSSALTGTHEPGFNPRLKEPPLPLLEPWEHLAGGCVVVDGPELYLVEPKGHFGGYSHTFPKGTVDPGENVQDAALRELREETGLEARIVGYLGDYQGDTSTTRMYVATRTGGSPNGGNLKETASVPKVHLLQAYELCNKDRDKDIVTDTAQWLQHSWDKVHKFDPHHDSHGRFSSTDGTGGTDRTTSLKRVKKPLFDGTPQLVEHAPSKQDVGKIGEHIAQTYLRQFLGAKDAVPANTENPSYPIDLRYDHALVECKAGLVSNTPAAQKWRITLGEGGPAEKAWLKTAAPLDKARWNAHKQDLALERKQAVRKEFGEKFHTAYRAETITTILHPDRGLVDVYHFQGWHKSIPWKSQKAKEAYVGTFAYTP